MTLKYPKGYVGRVDRFQKTSDWKAHANRLASFIATDLGDKPIDIMDYGCGTGAFLDRLLEDMPNAVITGADVNEGMLEAVTISPNVKIKQSNEDGSGVAGGSYDAIIFMNSIGHAENPQEVLSNVIPTLKAGGRVFVSNSNKAHTRLRWVYNYLYGFKGDPTLLHHYTRRELVQLFTSMGLELIGCYWEGSKILGVSKFFVLEFK